MNDKDLICEICNVHYDLLLFLPICIPCGHTMCFPCLKDKYKKHGKIKCKNDEKTFNLKPELYAKNYYIIKLLQNQKILNQKTNNENNSRNSYISRNSISNININLDPNSNYNSNDNFNNQKILSNRESIVNPFLVNSEGSINDNANANLDHIRHMNINGFSNSNSNGTFNSNANSASASASISSSNGTGNANGNSNNSNSKIGFRFSGNSKINLFINILSKIKSSFFILFYFCCIFVQFLF